MVQMANDHPLAEWRLCTAESTQTGHLKFQNQNKEWSKSIKESLTRIIMLLESVQPFEPKVYYKT